MKKEIQHFIMFNYHGQCFTTSFSSPYPLTLTAMVKRFFLLAIDEGRSLAEMTDIEFVIGKYGVLGATDGIMLRRFYDNGRHVGPINPSRTLPHSP